MRHGNVFHVDRADPLTTGLDHVFAAVGDLHEAFGVYGGNVTSRKPAPTIGVAAQRVAAFVLEVAGNHPRPAHQQVAAALAVPGQLPSVGVDDFHVDAEDRPTLLEQNLALLLGWQRELGIFQCTHGAQGRHFGHAPGVQHRHPVALAEGLDHGRRTGRTPNYGALEAAEFQPPGLHVVEQHLPDRRHTGGHADLLALQQFVDRLAIERRAGKHQLAAHRGGRIRNAPGVDVKHRHHRQHAVARAQVERIGQSSRISMQQGRAVRIQRGLGVAGGAAGVAHAGGGVLVEIGPVVVAGVRTDPGFIALQSGDAAVGGQPLGVAQRDPVPHRRTLGRHRLHQRQERQVKAQRLVLGVVDDPGQLLGVQARVERVQHAPAAADAKIQLQMAVAVPGQRGQPLAPAQAQVVDGVGHLARATRNLRPGAAMNVAFDPARNDLAAGVVALGVRDERRNQQGLWLHLS